MTIFLVPLFLALQTANPPTGCIDYGNTQVACQELDRQEAATEKKLNSVYRLLLKRLEAKHDDAFFNQARLDLIDAQRAWVTFRDKDCEARASNYRALQLLGGAGNDCRLNRATQRTQELQEMLDDLGALDEP